MSVEHQLADSELGHAAHSVIRRLALVRVVL